MYKALSSVPSIAQHTHTLTHSLTSDQLSWAVSLTTPKSRFVTEVTAQTCHWVPVTSLGSDLAMMEVGSLGTEGWYHETETLPKPPGEEFKGPLL